MTEAPETRYARDITLGADDDRLREVAVAIDSDVAYLAKSLYPESQGYHVVPLQRGGRDAGFAVAKPGWRTEVSCTSGNNIRYMNGEETRYFSYSVGAESVIPAVVRAEKLGRELAGLLKFTFAIAFCVLLFIACRLLATYLDMESIGVPAVLFVGAFALGGYIGTALGELVGGIIATIVTARAYRQPAVQDAFAAWDILQDGLDQVLDRAELEAESRGIVEAAV